MASAGTAGLPRAVLFDWDNTLVDNWGCIHAALNAALAWDGQPGWTLAETRLRVRQSLRDSFPRLFGKRWEQARDVFYDHFARHHLDHLRPLPGAEALLRHLAGRGLYLGVVSNKTGTFLRAEAAALGWTPLFGRLVGATDAARDKPATDPVMLALAPSGLAPGRSVWFVGDADIDMECAHNAGCVPVLVGGDLDAAGGARFPPEHHAADCDILCALVRSLEDPICLEAAADR